jgi:hypothetical protein
MVWLRYIILVTLCAPALAADIHIEAKFEASAEANAARLKEQIGAEISRLGSHAWAGEYYCGDGLGVNVTLMIAPESGFVFEWHGCLGLYDRNYGTTTASDGKIRLTPTFPNVREGFQGISEEFIPVQWGNRGYLIPADEMVGFCNEANSGSEPREVLHGWHLLRQGDEKKKVGGLPIVPEQFQTYLLDEQVTASIVNLGSAEERPADSDDVYFSEIAVVLDKGNDARLLPGMELHVVKPRRAYGTITIHNVGKDTAAGTLEYFPADRIKPEVGWKVSTRAR